MRLIDKDRLLKGTNHYWLEMENFGDIEAIDVRFIEMADEVKAIPIEWMQQMIEEDKTSGHIDEYGEYQEGTTLGESCEHVLANWYNTYKWKWEKENEAN